MFRSTFITLSLGLLAVLPAGGCQSGTMGGGSASGGRASGGGSGWANIFQTGGRGEAWTIECKRIPEDIPNRKETIARMAAALGQVRGIDPGKIQVSHNEDASYVYYGTYRANERDGRTTFDQDALNQAAAIRGLASGDVHLFLEAHLVPVPTPDVGPAEWHVKHCPGSYTLDVGEFYNERRFTERKEAAVEFCRLLREKGYEAYYWHGPQRSNVCVGAWEHKKDFLITPEGIYPGPKLKKLIESEPDLLMYKIVNGGYSTQLVNGKKVRFRTTPIEVPGRATESEPTAPPRPRYRSMRR